MSKLLEIASGWYNMVHSTPEMRAIAIERLELCDVCPHKVEVGQLTAAVISLASASKSGTSQYKCGVCGCALSAKTLSRDSHCPIGNW